MGWVKHLGRFTAGILLGHCAKTEFAPLSEDQRLNAGLPLIAQQKLVVQDQVLEIRPDVNLSRTDVWFRISDDQGQPILEYTPVNDLVLTDQGTTISQYEWTHRKVVNERVADVVLAVDITGSMTPSIDRVKAHLARFVDEAYASGKRFRFCLLTFGDYTVKHCDRFYWVDASNSESQKDIANLKNELSQLRALKGHEDPGGTDLNENPMRAIIDAASAPFGPEHDRFVIVITDDMFLYSPGKTGQVGRLAPYYHEVLEAIESARLKIFAVTPPGPGYNQPFRVQVQGQWNTYPSVVEFSSGQYFSFRAFVSDQITLTQILDHVYRRVLALYRFTYAPENFRINPWQQPAKHRNIQAQSRKNPNWRFELVNVQEELALSPTDPFRISLPELNEWDDFSLRIMINGMKTAFKKQGHIIDFSSPIQPGDHLRVIYRYKEKWKNLPPVSIQVTGYDPRLLWVTLNGRRLYADQYEWIKIRENSWKLSLNWSKVVLEPHEDAFKIQVWLTP